VTTTAGTATAVEAGTTSAVDPLAYRGLPDGSAAVRTADLFERHGATVLGFCRMLLRNEHEAEDAAQQTFLAAYRSIRNGIEPRHPAAWLATIARNECWAAIEHRMRQPVHQGEPESGLPDPVVQAAANADLEELWRAIGELPRQQRQALLLREFSGLTYAELAGALGVTEPAVESLLVRARRALRRRLRPLSGSAAAVTAPLVTLRDALARLLLGMPDAPSASGLSKLAAGAAAAVVAGGTVVAVESHDVGRAVAMPAKASALPTAVPRAAVRRAVVTRRTPTTSRATTRSPRHVQSVRPKRLASPASRPVSAPAVSAPRPEPLPAPSPQRGAAPVPPLPRAAPVREEPVVQATPSAAGDEGGPGDSSGSGASGADSSGPGEGSPGGHDGEGAAAVESSGSGSGGEVESGSASSGPGGGQEQVSSGEGPAGATESGEGGGDDGKSGSGGGGDDHVGGSGSGGDGHSHGSG
jgi:RNA polymerase sigma factor (sigma-70 family)